MVLHTINRELCTNERQNVAACMSVHAGQAADVQLSDILSGGQAMAMHMANVCWWGQVCGRHMGNMYLPFKGRLSDNRASS